MVWDFKDYEIKDLEKIMYALNILVPYGLADEDMVREIDIELKKRKGGIKNG